MLYLPSPTAAIDSIGFLERVFLDLAHDTTIGLFMELNRLAARRVFADRVDLAPISEVYANSRANYILRGL